jgi:hypothetical protein
MDLHNSPFPPLENHPPSPSAENVFVSIVTPKDDSPQKSKNAEKAEEKNVLRRKRGAQFCNNNARKHGFYSNRLPKADLRGVDNTFINSLEDEIVMMRVFLRRLVAHSAEVHTLEQELELMRAVCLATLSITRMIRTQHYITPYDSENSRLLDAALTELMEENPELFPPFPSRPAGVPKSSLLSDSF